MKEGHLEICGLELGPWKKEEMTSNNIYDRFLAHSQKTYKDLKIRVQRESAGIWSMYVWDELDVLSEHVEKWQHITIGRVDDRIVLDAADEFLVRLEKMRSFE